MRLVWSWLRHHLEGDFSVADVSERLTSLGLEVESVRQQRADLSVPFVVEVMRIERHPDAQRLHLCWWRDAGGRSGRVVCGAPNLRVGCGAFLLLLARN